MRKAKPDKAARSRDRPATGKSVAKRAKKAKPARREREPQEESFECFQCGARVPYSSDRCPSCMSYYIRGLRPTDVDELLRAEEMRDPDMGDFIESLSSPVLHFDAETGVVRFMDGQSPRAAGLECQQCGTVIEMTTDACPMCGHIMAQPDLGLIGVLDGSEFDPGRLQDVDCPFCGERVTLKHGRCPDCGELLERAGRGEPGSKLLPVLRLSGVVFLRLDVDAGEICFLRRNGTGCGYGHALIGLGHADGDVHGRTRSGSSRG